MGRARLVGCGKYKWNPRALEVIGENLSGTMGPAKESLALVREVFQLWRRADRHPGQTRDGVLPPGPTYKDHAWGIVLGLDLEV